MVTNRGRKLVEQRRKPAYMIWMRVCEPIRTNLQLVSPEKSRYLLSFAAWINDNRKTFLPDHKAVGNESRDNGLHTNLLNLNATRFHLIYFLLFYAFPKAL
jgi:hypothetical protein